MAVVRKLILIVTCCSAIPSMGQTVLGRRVSQIPMAPKAQKSDPLRIKPALEIPQNPDAYTFQIEGSGDIPVFSFKRGQSSPLGTISAGTQVAFIGVRKVGRVHYYAIPWTGSGYDPDGGLAGKSMAWVSGHYLKAVSYTPGK